MSNEKWLSAALESFFSQKEKNKEKEIRHKECGYSGQLQFQFKR